MVWIPNLEITLIRIALSVCILLTGSRTLNAFFQEDVFASERRVEFEEFLDASSGFIDPPHKTIANAGEPKRLIEWEEEVSISVIKSEPENRFDHTSQSIVKAPLVDIVAVATTLRLNPQTRLGKLIHKNPRLRSLEIHAREILIDDNLILPQTEVTIFASSLRFSGATAKIITSPLANENWTSNSVKGSPQLNNNQHENPRNGNDGPNAGNITLVVDHLDIGGVNRFELGGGPGQNGAGGGGGEDPIGDEKEPLFQDLGKHKVNTKDLYLSTSTALYSQLLEYVPGNHKDLSPLIRNGKVVELTGLMKGFSIKQKKVIFQKPFDQYAVIEGKHLYVRELTRYDKNIKVKRGESPSERHVKIDGMKVPPESGKDATAGGVPGVGGNGGMLATFSEVPFEAKAGNSGVGIAHKGQIAGKPRVSFDVRIVPKSYSNTFGGPVYKPDAFVFGLCVTKDGKDAPAKSAASPTGLEGQRISLPAKFLGPQNQLTNVDDQKPLWFTSLSARFDLEIIRRGYHEAYYDWTANRLNEFILRLESLKDRFDPAAEEWQRIRLETEAMREQVESGLDAFGNPLTWYPNLTLADGLELQKKTRDEITQELISVERLIKRWNDLSEYETAIVDAQLELENQLVADREALVAVSDNLGEVITARNEFVKSAEVYGKALASETELVNRLAKDEASKYRSRQKGLFIARTLLAAGGAGLTAAGVPAGGVVAETISATLGIAKSEDEVQLQGVLEQSSGALQAALADDLWPANKKDEKSKDNEKSPSASVRKGLSKTLSSVAKLRKIHGPTQEKIDKIEAKFLAKIKKERDFESLVVKTKEYEAKKAILNDQLEQVFESAALLDATMVQRLAVHQELSNSKGDVTPRLKLSVQTFLDSWRNRLLSRIQRHHYYLVKSYESFALRPYPGDRDLRHIRHSLEVLTRATKEEKEGERNVGISLDRISVEQRVETAFAVYDKERNALVERLTDEIVNMEFDARRWAMTPSTTNYEFELSEAELQSLNTERGLEIDLSQPRRFLNSRKLRRVIFNPRHRLARLNRLEVVECETTQDSNQSHGFQIELKFADGGILQDVKGDLHRIFRGDPNQNETAKRLRDLETFELVSRDRVATILPHDESPTWKNLLNIIAGNGLRASNLYNIEVAPPLLTSIGVGIVDPDNSIQITRLRFRVRYEYYLGQ